MALNSKLFIENNGECYLKDDIRQKLGDIADVFIDYLKDQGVNLSVADIRIVGSSVGHDFTEFSDIDLHIVADFEATTCDTVLLGIALNAERKSFNSTYNISVKGIPVEIYVEDVNAATISNGIYSITYDKWIKFPEPDLPISDEYEALIPGVISNWEDLISKTILSNRLSEIQRVINRLYMIRKNSLETVGRYGAGNHLFKQLRNRGLLDQLKDKRIELISNSLTLENKFIVESLLKR